VKLYCIKNSVSQVILAYLLGGWFWRN